MKTKTKKTFYDKIPLSPNLESGATRTRGTRLFIGLVIVASIILLIAPSLKAAEQSRAAGGQLFVSAIDAGKFSADMKKLEKKLEGVIGKDTLRVFKKACAAIFKGVKKSGQNILRQAGKKRHVPYQYSLGRMKYLAKRAVNKGTGFLGGNSLQEKKAKLPLVPRPSGFRDDKFSLAARGKSNR